MRWKIKESHREPFPGDVRIKKFFALFPEVIEEEARWLETIKVKQKYIHYWNGDLGGAFGWQSQRFIDGTGRVGK